MILEKIRYEIEHCGQSRNQISQATGVDNTVLFRIVNGGSCSVETADILCKYFGLELKPKMKGR